MKASVRIFFALTLFVATLGAAPKAEAKITTVELNGHSYHFDIDDDFPPMETNKPNLKKFQYRHQYPKVDSIITISFLEVQQPLSQWAAAIREQKITLEKLKNSVWRGLGKIGLTNTALFGAESCDGKCVVQVYIKSEGFGELTAEEEDLEGMIDSIQRDLVSRSFLPK